MQIQVSSSGNKSRKSLPAALQELLNRPSGPGNVRAILLLPLSCQLGVLCRCSRYPSRLVSNRTCRPARSRKSRNVCRNSLVWLTCQNVCCVVRARHSLPYTLLPESGSDHAQSRLLTAVRDSRRTGDHSCLQHPEYVTRELCWAASESRLPPCVARRI